MTQGSVWLSLATQIEGAKSDLRNFLDQMLTFLYTVAHQLDQLAANFVQAIIHYQLPTDLIDPLGLLILLTVLLAISAFAKRLVWITMLVCCILITSAACGACARSVPSYRPAFAPAACSH